MKEDILDFEKQIIVIKEKLEKLTNPQITLKESVELYKSGILDIKSAQKLLDDARLEFEKLNKD